MKKRWRLVAVLLVAIAVGTVVAGRRLDWWEAEPRRGTEAFEFDRTASRLIEMQSRDWLDGWAARQAEKTPPAKAVTSAETEKF